MQQADKQRAAGQTTTVEEAQNQPAARKEYQPPRFEHPTEKPHGPTLTAQGVIHGVKCSDPAAIEFEVAGAQGTVKLYNNNYYEIGYSAANFTPQGEIHPCSDLEGMKAKVQYFATADKTVDGQIMSVELSK
jgi:hypothetical protein